MIRSGGASGAASFWPTPGTAAPKKPEPSKRSAPPRRTPLSPTHGRFANLSTVAITKHGRRRNSGSSTATIGNAPLPERNGHAGFAQPILSSRGSSAVGESWNESPVNFVPHHGQFSSGTGAGRFLVSPWKYIVFVRADRRSLSPFLPMRFGVAARPTHNPTSNGHSPSLFPASSRR